MNNIDNELAKSRIDYGVNQITKSQKIRDKAYNKKLIDSQHYRLKKLPKILKDNILVLLIIPLLGLGVYGFSQWKLVSETPIVIVTEIPSPIPKKVNPEKPEIAEVKTQPTPLSSPAKQSAYIPTKTIILPPPDPFTLAVNRAMNAAEMVQSAQSKIEWEAVASQWQDATELMEIVPVSHPKYKEARKKIKEYQRYADYAIRVGKIKR
ncbi:MAG: hypothetical protein F6K22_18615 [Okeania sp. SIO2F4]|uniref:hypothetical protein n=1 Tax=Okeania sp. SIO2F4 TaxID=2607790 RepID=UPI00142BB695|nr:hypothetical protein [Okeania sp. SIO2F4]NES04663.1 hypothetical protein [Okeania sp. SIO2F4]